jgi:drug/metabolite transporter (DMT)-like permease
LGLWAAAITGVQVGAAMVMSRAVLPEIGPVTLAAFRYGIGVLVLAPLVLALRPALLRQGVLGPVAALGVAQFGLLVVLLNWGLQRIGAAEASLIFASFPVLTVLIASALGRERLTARRLGGAALTFAGVAVALGARPVAGDLWGAAAVFLAALLGAGSALATRPYLARNPTLRVGAMAMLAAALVLAALAVPVEGLPFRPAAPTAALIAAIGLASGAGYVLWLTALKFAEAGEATVLLGLAPIAAAVLGMVFLGETPGPALWLGAVVALAGVTLTVLPARPKRPAQTAAGR